MKYAKYYNVSSFVEKMTENGEVAYPTGDDRYLGIYVCMDTNDFWISRILKGYDEEYEKNPDKYLVERNKFSNEDVVEKSAKYLTEVSLPLQKKIIVIL